MTVEYVEGEIMDKDTWVRYMRTQHCPPEMVDGDGELILEYFQPKTSATDGVIWTDDDELRLISGIEEFGIGSWAEIKQKYLPVWDEIAIRLKSCLLLGTQNLEKYSNWRGNRDAIDEEYATNQTLAENTQWTIGCIPDQNFGLLIQSAK